MIQSYDFVVQLGRNHRLKVSFSVEVEDGVDIATSLQPLIDKGQNGVNIYQVEKGTRGDDLKLAVLPQKILGPRSIEDDADSSVCGDFDSILLCLRLDLPEEDVEGMHERFHHPGSESTPT